MKRIVSVSLGSSKRNHQVEMEFLGEKVYIERRGTDGDLEKAIALIAELDGQVDAFGMGGIDLYLFAGKRKYMVKDAARMARAAQKSPIVDGSGLKNTLERRVVRFLETELGLRLKDRTVLMVSAVDRFGMAEAFDVAGCRMIFGDIIFALGLPIPLTRLSNLNCLARLLLPVITRLPFTFLYPTGSKQDQNIDKYLRYYQAADIIAGDFLYIKKYLPKDLTGKIIITNTVTAGDIEELARRRAELLVTSTPEMMGRSFGTNVMEALLVSFSGKRPEELTEEDYQYLLEQLQFKPRVVQLNAPESRVKSL